MPRTRVGVVVLPPPDVSTEIDTLRRACGDPQLGRIPTHLTLVPPVNVRDDAVEEGLASLHDALQAVESFVLTVGPASTFLPATPVLYLAVNGDLDALHDLRRRVFRPPFARAVEWPFVPHVTVRDEMEPARIEAAVEAMADYRATIDVESVHVLRDEGGTWRPLADLPFGPPAVIGRGSLELVIGESRHLDPDAQAFADRVWKEHDDARFGPGTRWTREPFAFTARREGRVVGIATGWTALGVSYLSELLVGRDARRQGIGSHLLAAFESLAARQDATRLALRADAQSDAVAFYERHGWRVEARLADWLGGSEFVQMRRDLA
ncbi:MAG: GNAT family N-acetyltransferase [Actinobacteria bacterium]|nr:GNAT family N-acetyltransferase [Actinomycetota bacterium]